MGWIRTGGPHRIRGNTGKAGVCAVTQGMEIAGWEDLYRLSDNDRRQYPLRGLNKKRIMGYTRNRIGECCRVIRERGGTGTCCLASLAAAINYRPALRGAHT